MEDAIKKITIQLPESLLKKALQASGEGITATIRQGLRLIAASNAYDAMRAMRGKVKFSIDIDKLRQD